MRSIFDLPTRSGMTDADRLEESPRSIMKISESCPKTSDLADRLTSGARLLSATLLPLFLGGCSLLPGSVPYTQSVLQSGSIGLSRPIPLIAEITNHQPLLGFMPSQHTEAKPRLEIDKSSEQVILVTSDGSRKEIRGRGFEMLPKGTYSVALKQESPLWYAPNSYFENRGLEVPAEGSKERFRRGALGSYTIFLSNQSPLHSGPANCSDLNGIQMAESDLKGLFEAVEVGMAVEVL
jgi:hypothetical protein